MMLTPHSNEWYDELARRQEGYFYPWKSTIEEPNGETQYLKLVEKHISIDKDVLDVGCGHGEVALDIAHKCKTIIAYDRVPSFINLAKSEQEKRNIHKVSFICFNSKNQTNKKISVPAKNNSIDLVISRRGLFIG